MAKIKLKVNRIFKEQQMFDAFQDKINKANKEVRVAKEDLQFLLDFAKLGYELKQRNFDLVWDILFPVEEMERISTDKATDFFSDLSAPFRHMCGLLKVESIQMDCEEAVRNGKGTMFDKDRVPLYNWEFESGENKDA